MFMFTISWAQQHNLLNASAEMKCAHLYACAYTCVLSRACMCLHFNMFLCHMSYVYVHSPYPCENELCVRAICDMPCRYIYAMCHADICHVRGPRERGQMRPKYFSRILNQNPPKSTSSSAPPHYSTFSTKRKPMARWVDTLMLHYQCDIEFIQYGRGDIKPWHISFSPKHII